MAAAHHQDGDGAPRVTASLLAEFSARDGCERFLRTAAQRPRGRPGVASDADEEEAPQIARGKAFEADLQRGLEENAEVAFVQLEREDDFAQTALETLRNLREFGVRLVVLAQAPLALADPHDTPFTGALYEAGVRFGMARPDFIFASPETNELFVVDAKSSAAVKTSHQVQVALYIILLEKILRQHGLTDMRVSRFGGIWLPGTSKPWPRDGRAVLESGPVDLSLEGVIQSVSGSLPADLQRIFTNEEAALDWRLTPSCATCHAVHRCRDISNKADIRLGHVPYLPADQEAESLHRNERLADIEDIFVSRPGNLRSHLAMRGDVSALRAVLEDPTPRVEVRPDLFLCSFFDLSPRREESETLVIDALDDPRFVPEQALGISCFFYETNVEVSWASTEPEEEFVNSLHDKLESLQGRSLACIVWNRHAAQVFTRFLVGVANAADSTEFTRAQACAIAWAFGDRSLLAECPRSADLFGATEPLKTPFTELPVATLRARLERFEDTRFVRDYTSTSSPEKRLKNGTGLKKEGLAEMFYFYEALQFYGILDTGRDNLEEAEELIAAAKHGFYERAGLSSVAHLESFISRHFLLPAAGYYTFEDCLRAFCTHQDADAISDPACASDAANVEIKNCLSRRTRLIHKMALSVHELAHNERDIYALKPAPCFALPRLLPIYDPVLVKMVTKEQLRTLSGALKCRLARAKRPVDELVADGKIFELTAAGQNRRLPKDPGNRDCTFLANEATFADLRAIFSSPDSLGQWILVSRSPLAWKKLMAMSDLQMMDTHITKIPIATGVSVPQRANNANSIIIRTRGVCCGEGEDRFPQEGRRYYLVKRYINFTCKKVIEEAVALSNSDPAGYLSLLRNPAVWRRSERESRPLGEIMGLPDLHPSQRAAAEACARERLQVIWGPPGSGKTYTVARIACSILQTLAVRSANYAQRSPLVVVFMATTNSAVQTCLRQVIDASEGQEVFIRQISPSKSDVEDIQTIPPGKITQAELDKHRGELVFLGATPWQLFKCALVKRNRADFGTTHGLASVLVADEASQMHEAHAALGLRAMNPEHGRLIVVGDHMQLAPIEGADTGDNMQVQARSFLDACIMDDIGQAMQDGIASRLRENLRMNAAMSVTLHGIYGDDYVAYAEHARRSLQLRFADARAPHPLLQRPEVGLHLICAQELGQRVASDASEHRRAEASFAGRILESYSEWYAPRLETTWEETVLVVTPHHVQRRAVREDLRKRFGPVIASRVCVDTVEKAQGRTFHLVIVLYGVFPRSTLAREACFLFDERRLNVAISRARYRTIVLAGEEFFSPPVSALLQPSAARGWAALCRLRDFAEAQGTPASLQVNYDLLAAASSSS